MLKNYFIEYKPFLLFLGKFFLSYLILTFIYQSYLSKFDQTIYQVDGFTTVVANQTQNVIQFFDGSVSISKHNTEPSIKIFYNNKWIARIIEGCNGLSVIILFISFVIAFSGRVITTIIYLIFGTFIIHVLNISRIALLTVLIYYFPEYQEVLHGVLFPLIIYGIVFLLWVIWVNKFSNYATKTAF